MSVPLPLPIPSPLVALPSSLVARRTITACHQKCTGEGEWAGLATATLTVPLPALGLSLPGSRGHCSRGCHTATPTSSFATTCGCHHRGAVSNKMRHSPYHAGEPSAPSASLQGAGSVG